MSPGFAIAGLLLLLGTGPAPQPALDEAFLDRVEARVTLPFKARPLAAYSRSYFALPGGTKVIAVYSLYDPPGRRWVQSHPRRNVLDAGCALITSLIDIATETPDSTECAGEA